MKMKTLPEKQKKARRIFWKIYLGSIAFIIGATVFSMLMIILSTTPEKLNAQELLHDLAGIRLKWFLENVLYFLLIFFIYSIPFVGIHRYMRMAQDESLEHYLRMTEEEKRMLDCARTEEMRVGDVYYGERYFLFRDKRRLFFYHILFYDEVIWAYLSQSVYQFQNEEKMLMSPVLRFTTIALKSKDGRMYSILMGDYAKLVKHLSANTILGYGREQKRQAKERQKWFAEYDSYLPAKRRAIIRKNLCIAAVMVLTAAVGIGFYAFLESDYCEYLRLPNIARQQYAAEEYFDSLHYYQMAQKFLEKREDILSHIRVAGMKEYWSNGEGSSEKFYDEAGNITTSINYDKDENEKYRTEYRYDEQGNFPFSL